MFNIYRQIMTAVTILSALIVPIFISSCDAIDKKNTKTNNTVPDNGGDNTVPDNGGDNTVPDNGGDNTVPDNG
ncbi:MAG: hypothetical protein ISP86_05045, partial [Shewanellaceae bacterium]|nr:hypothetical protein [Shewanellaceae bacterium]